MEESLAAFTKLFAKHGYQVCGDGNPEEGYQKLALFAKDGVPTHAARQLSDGKWTSKIGGHVDVRHTLAAMEGGHYGDVALYFKKQLPKDGA